MQVSVRECIMGEVYTNTRCVVCGNGTYSANTHPPAGTCRTCPPGGTCYGSTMLVAAPGYFQTSIVSENIYKCAAG